MSTLFNKLISKLLAIMVIVLFVVGFREMILTDSNVSTAFGELMGVLPFAKLITDAICKVMKYQYTIPGISVSSVFTDFLRLAVMACIQPFLVGILSAIFLQIPNGDYYQREEYMDSLGYRSKEMLLTIISAPMIALAASYISAGICDFINTNFSTFGAVLSGIITSIIVVGLSLIPLLAVGVSIGTAIAWRLLVTLSAKMVTTFMTNAICLWIYLSFMRGIQKQIVVSIFSLIIWLIIMDFGMQCLRRAVVS